jgi:hypothetical protein
MNLLIIGEEVDELAKTVWKANTNYTIVNMSPFLWGNDFKKFSKKHKQLIITSTSAQFLTRGVDDFINLMSQYDMLPVFIAKDKDAIERAMHTNVEEIIPHSVLFIGNEKSEKYPELVELLQDYLKGFGNGDNTIQTPREGEGITTN